MDGSLAWCHCTPRFSKAQQLQLGKLFPPWPLCYNILATNSCCIRYTYVETVSFCGVQGETRWFSSSEGWATKEWEYRLMQKCPLCLFHDNSLVYFHIPCRWYYYKHHTDCAIQKNLSWWTLLDLLVIVCNTVDIIVLFSVRHSIQTNSTHSTTETVWMIHFMKSI